MRAGIAFGSNLGDRLLMLRQARACLVASPLLAPPVLVSSVYLTSPVDCPPGSESFFNAVMEAELTGDPLALFQELLDLEQSFGKAPRPVRNAPRVIDLDLLYAGDLRVRSSNLTLPHARIGERRFVLAPLAEIRPGLVLPGRDKTVRQLLEGLAAGDTAEVLDAKW
jgi:2-amino-4-hydroxy-6-hydroxymethyldihydropteridine diphosphokinase